MKNLKVFLGLLVCAFMVVPFMGVKASNDITNYDMKAYIQEDGTIHIDESITYYFSSSANGLTRDLRYYYKTNKDTMEANSARYQATGIENLTVAVTNESNITTDFIKVSDAEKGDSGIYTVDSVTSDKTEGYPFCGSASSCCRPAHGRNPGAQTADKPKTASWNPADLRRSKRCRRASWASWCGRSVSEKS